jgi:hypothetical protein
LYNCGKVCLSLLGTWAGPGWDPAVSTLLQVIVSIQSLIMVDDPYFNEPGFEVTRGTPRGDAMSASYNRPIRTGCMRFAILDMINHPPYLFRDVLKVHFALKEKEIRAQIWDWANEATAEPGEAASQMQQIQQTFPNLSEAVFNLYGATQGGRMKELAEQIDRALDALVKQETGVPKAPPRAASSQIVIADEQVPSARRQRLQLKAAQAAAHDAEVSIVPAVAGGLGQGQSSSSVGHSRAAAVVLELDDDDDDGDGDKKGAQQLPKTSPAKIGSAALVDLT